MAGSDGSGGSPSTYAVSKRLLDNLEQALGSLAVARATDSNPALQDAQDHMEAARRSYHELAKILDLEDDMATGNGDGKKVETWWTKHGGAVLAFVGAGGAMVAAIAPGLEAAVGPWLQTGLIVIGIAGAVIHAYLRTPEGV